MWNDHMYTSIQFSLDTISIAFREISRIKTAPNFFNYVNNGSWL